MKSSIARSSAFLFILAISLLLAGCATGQGGNDTAGQVFSGILQGIGQGLSGL